jgi:hypothetical protein
MDIEMSDDAFLVAAYVLAVGAMWLVVVTIPG